MQKFEEKPQLVVSAIVQKGDKFLLVQRMKPPSKDMYAFPGGKVEPGESLEQAAVRELIEETGLNGTSPKLYKEYETRSEGFHFHLHVFKVDVSEFKNLQAMDDAKSVGWFTIEEARKLKMPNNMIDCFKFLERETPA